jgi:hypothetical protein
MDTRSLKMVALTGAMSLGALALGTTVSSAAVQRHIASVNLNSKCSQGSIDNLQIQREDTGQFSIDAGVDITRHSAGVPWSIKITENGIKIVSLTTPTLSDSSMSISRLAMPSPGVNHIVFVARNQRTGESCVVRTSM